MVRVLTLIFLLISGSCMSQIIGKVIDEFNLPIENVDVTIENSDEYKITDANGNFTFNLVDGIYNLTFSAMGYETQKNQVIIVNQLQKELTIVMQGASTLLEDLVIMGKTKSQVAREQSYAVEVVDMKNLKNISTDVNEILGKVSGVNIRQSGGLGSKSTMSLNGFYGNQVKTFINGIPMHYFGTALNLSNFPSNLVDQIEVYKGVVPIHLSSDALGGAVNIMTNIRNENFFDASYALGSFDTNRLAINGQYRFDSGFTMRLKSFYNISENNYKVPVVSLADSENIQWFEKFNDAYSSKMLWAELGYTDVPLADEFMIGALISSNYKEIQQMPNAIGQANVPFGDVFTKENKNIFNLSYKKRNLIPRLSTSIYAVTVNSDELVSDISDYIYDWEGERTLKDGTVSTGESGYLKTQLNLNKTNYLANVNNEYTINDSNNLALNYSLNSFTIEGTDSYQKSNNVRFKDPSNLTKQILALSYTNRIGSNFKSSVFSKYYTYSINTFDTDYSGIFRNDISEYKDDYGLGFTASYFLGDLQFKTSYEKCFRYPEVIEIFGNGIEVTPNPELKPESSQNLNLGFLYNLYTSRNKLSLSVNSFYRKGKNYIYPINSTIVEYINAIQAKTKGIDVSFNYDYDNKLLINFNTSYYTKINDSKWSNAEKTVANFYYEMRFPNEPYLFGNIVTSYRCNNLIYNKDLLTLSLRYNYVHSFSYKWSKIAFFNKKIVPTQQTSDLEVVYSLDNNKYNMCFGITNLFDKTVYDNFNQVKPGRSLRLKIRYFIN